MLGDIFRNSVSNSLFIFASTTQTKDFFTEFAKNLSSVDYLFSTASQTVASLVALSIAGFALVFSMLESSEKREEDRIEINSRLREMYFKRVKAISIISAPTIILDLFDLVINGTTFPDSIYIYMFSSVANALCIVLAFWFVVDMINPNKDVKVARYLLKHGKRNASPTDNTVSEAEFAKLFIELERKIRHNSVEIEMVPSVTYRQVSFVPLRRLIETFYKSGIINTELYDQFTEVNHYRNLVVHGQVETVDSKMYNLLQKVYEKISDIFKEDDTNSE